MNFYTVKIGQNSRSGNMIVNHEFVCQTESTSDIVRNHYSKKYSGFTVSVNAVEHVETLEVVNNPVVVENKSNEIYNLNRKIKELTEAKTEHVFKIRFDGEILSKETKEIWSLFVEKSSEAYNVKTELKKAINKEILEKYSIVAKDAKVEETLSSNRINDVDISLYLKGSVVTSIKNGENL